MKNELIHLVEVFLAFYTLFGSSKQSETWFPIDFDIAHDPALNLSFLCHHQ